MLLSKKIAKLQRRPELRSHAKKMSENPPNQPDESEQESNFKEKGKVRRYRFRQIPPHSKFVCNEPVYAIHGVNLTSFFRNFSTNSKKTSFNNFLRTGL